MTVPAIAAVDLTKVYRGTAAVDRLSFAVRPGTVTAFLGPNGAGKTSTVEILEGHRKRTSGTVSVLGHDPGKGERAFKERIGIVLQETGMNRFLTVAEVIAQFRA